MFEQDRRHIILGDYQFFFKSKPKKICFLCQIKWLIIYFSINQGYIRPLLCQNHSTTFVYGSILMKICMNANIIKTLFKKIYIWPEMCHLYVLDKFCDFLL